MAKVTAPLLSFGGSGQIAKAQVYSKWRGISYARRYTVPADTPSVQKDHTRGVFSWLTQTWRFLPGVVQQVWTTYAKGRPLTDRNAWIKSNLNGLRGTGTSYATDIGSIVISPGVLGGFVGGIPALTDAGSHKANITMSAPSLPDGWSVTQAHYVGLDNVDAWDSTDYQSVYGNSTTPTTYAGNVTFTSSGNKSISGFFEFATASGDTAFGPSKAATVVLA